MIEQHKMINRIGAYWKNQFGKKVYKVIAKGDFTCPNLDGSLSQAGCIFCDMQALLPLKSNNHDINTQMQYLSDRNHAAAFFVYFQEYSATYPSQYPRFSKKALFYLQNLFTNYLNHEKVVGLAIGTRPDTLNDDIVKMLADIKQKKDVIVELGLQSILDSDLQYINRGHFFESFQKAVSLLHKYQIKVVAHLIIGLPNETDQSLKMTAEIFNELKLFGIKLHQLMVLKNSKLAQMYNQNQVKVLTFQEYIKRIKIILGNLDPQITIHRLYADAPKKNLIAPTWSENKTGIQDTILNFFRQENFYQGKYLEP